MKVIRSFPTKKRKPHLCAALLFLLAALMLTSCAREPDYTTETDEAGIPNETLLARIENDYGKYLKETYGFEVDGKASVYCCYGIYDGCVPVMFQVEGIDTTMALRDIEVAGTVFHYRNGIDIEIWKDGDFYSLQEAYDEGLLTKEHLQTIADIQNEWYTDEN